jgi:hypothetical protein
VRKPKSKTPSPKSKPPSPVRKLKNEKRGKKPRNKMSPEPKSVYVFGVHVWSPLFDDEQDLISKVLKKYHAFYKCYESRYDQSASEELTFIVLYETVSGIDFRPQKIEVPSPAKYKMLDELYDELDELNITLEGKGMYHFVYYDEE